MKNSIFYFAAMMLVALGGCTHDNVGDTQEDNQRQDVIVMQNIDDSFYRIPDDDRIIAKELGHYMDYNIQTDYVVGLSSLKSDPLQKEYIYAYSSIYNTCNQTRAMSLDERMFSVKINGVTITDDTKTRGGMRVDWKPLYGSKVKFDIAKRSSATRSGVSQEDAGASVDLYIPELITITSPAIKTEEELYPLCDYKNFVLRWNKDTKNENGVIIVIEWIGTMVFGDHNPDVHIRRTDYVPDTGEVKLNPDLFKDIPDTALCYLTVLRGSVENILIDDYSYKVLGESHEVLPFILIRELKQQQQ